MTLGSTWRPSVPPERGAIGATEQAPSILLAASDEPLPGCNCGRWRKASPIAPLLSDDLVIASRARAREPELPEVTVAHALATPISARPARYDLILLPGAADDTGSAHRIAVEFARRDHRVFQYLEHPQAKRRPAAPTLHRLTWPDSSTPKVQTLETLASLRRSHTIEAAAVFVPATFDPATAAEIRRRWGWRIVTPATAPVTLANLSDITTTFSGDGAGTTNRRHVSLGEAMTWPERWAVLDRAIRGSWPKASIIVVTWDNLAFTRLCLDSVIANTEYPNYEVIVVDNASTDGTVEELQRLTGELPHVRLILNDHNAGFGPANNQGLSAASGDIFVVLNNDTVVPRGWLTRLARHLKNPAVGLLGPATNRTCNEAQIDVAYQTYGEFMAVARGHSERHEGERFPIRMPMMFCLAFRRDTYDRLGPLDERYETGMFEDEDYALRAKAAGLEVAWTPEVYVHHAYHASIGKLLPTGEYMRLVKLNQGRFEEKWGICWERHRPLPAQNA
jgi:GT2 family glycosyltransferase